MDLKIYGLLALLTLGLGGFFTNEYVLNPSSERVKGRALTYIAQCTGSCEENHADDYSAKKKCILRCDYSMCKKFTKKLQYCVDLSRYLIKSKCYGMCRKENPYNSNLEFSKQEIAADKRLECRSSCRKSFCEKFGDKAKYCVDKHSRTEFLATPTWEGTTKERYNHFR